jgi:hypothetical protein
MIDTVIRYKIADIGPRTGDQPCLLLESFEFIPDVLPLNDYGIRKVFAFVTRTPICFRVRTSRPIGPVKAFAVSPAGIFGAPRSGQRPEIYDLNGAAMKLEEGCATSAICAVCKT